MTIGPASSYSSESPDRLRAYRQQALLEETLLPSPNSRELNRTPESEYRHRLWVRPVQVAELYQENSKITPVHALNVALDVELLEHARSWYFGTAYRPNEGDLDQEAAAAAGVVVPVAQLEDPVGRFCAALLGDGATARLLYAIDPFLVVGAASYRLVAHGDLAWLDRRFADEELKSLSRAVRGMSREGRRAPALLVFAVAPWRYMALQGPRGYRRTLADLGRLLERCDDLARRIDMPAASTLDFHDGAVDNLLRLDGVERSAHAVYFLGVDPEVGP
jgi:hypothetical protein